MPLTQLLIYRDALSTPTYHVAFAGAGNVKTIRAQAGVATTLAVPTGAATCFISPTDFIFVSGHAAITLPVAGGGWQDCNGEIQKATVNLEGITTLYFMARQDTDITVAFFG